MIYLMDYRVVLVTYSIHIEIIIAIICMHVMIF